MLGSFKAGLPTLLDDAFTSLSGTTTRAVTKSALSQARKTVKASAFEALNPRLVELLSTLLPEPRWRGWRLVATYSTTLRAPPWLENQAEFGVPTDSGGQPYVPARALGLFSTRSRWMLHAVLDRFDRSERSLWVSVLRYWESTDLLIMDRGFPAIGLCVVLLQRGLPFLARIDGAQWPEVEALARSGPAELIVQRPVTAQARKQARAAGAELDLKTVTFRLIRVALPNGRIEILATSLTDATAFPAAEFAELYQERWGIEESYKVLKHRWYVEQFSGELPESIRQDFHAKVFTAHLAKALSRTAYESLPEARAAHYRPNLSYILQTLRTRIFCWLIQRVSAEQIPVLIELYTKPSSENDPNDPRRGLSLEATQNPGGSTSEPLNLTAMGLPEAPSSQVMEPPVNPGRFSSTNDVVAISPGPSSQIGRVRTIGLSVSTHRHQGTTEFLGVVFGDIPILGLSRNSSQPSDLDTHHGEDIEGPPECFSPGLWEEKCRKTRETPEVPAVGTARDG